MPLSKLHSGNGRQGRPARARLRRSWVAVGELVEDAHIFAGADSAGEWIAFDAQESGIKSCVLTDALVVRWILRSMVSHAVASGTRDAALRVSRSIHALRFTTSLRNPGNDERGGFSPDRLHRLQMAAGMLGGGFDLFFRPGAGTMMTLTLPAVDGVGNHLVQGIGVSQAKRGRAAIAA